MSYLLFIPIGLYIVLATVDFQRQPHNSANLALVLYVLSASAATSCYLVLGTTPNQQGAEVAAILTVVASAWSYMILLPLTLIGLYFEVWLRLYRRRLLIAFFFWAVVVHLALLALVLRSEHLVLPVSSHAWMHWLMAETYYWPHNALMALGAQVAYIPLIALAMHRRRIKLWHDAVPMTLVIFLTLLIPLLAPLAGAEALVMITALGHLPVVLYLTMLIVQSSRVLTLAELVKTTLQLRTDGLMVLDTERRVLWRNVQASRWLAGVPLSSVTRPLVYDLLQGTPLLGVVRNMLETGQMRGECQVLHDGEEHILQVECQPLPSLLHLPDARLLVLRDVTASRVRRNLEERRRELLALSAISANIASSLDMEQVIAQTVQQIVRATNADGVAMYLLDEHDPGFLNLVGFQLGSDRIVEPTSRIPVEKTMPGRAVKSCQMILTPDADQDPENQARLQRIGAKAGAVLPIVVREQGIGVIQIVYLVPHVFDVIQIAMIESVGQQIAVAVDHARLYRQEREQHRVTEVLRQVASIIATKKLDEALALMLSQLQELIEFDRATLLLLAEPGQLRIGASMGFITTPDDPPVEQVRIEIAKYTYLERLFDLQFPQIVANTSTDPQWVKDQYGYNSWMGVPICIHDQMVGCLSISHQAGGWFSPSDLRIATTFADQAALVVENARLFETEQRRRVQAELLQKASYELVTSPNLDSALTSALSNLSRLITFDQAQLGLINETRQAWTAYASYPLVRYPQTSHAIPITHFPLIQRLVEGRRPILVGDTRDDPLWRPTPETAPEFRSWMGVPLVVRDRAMGILNIYHSQPNGFTEEHFQIARTFANQIAAALENFRLLDEASRQNRALSALNTILAASNEALTHENLLGVLLERVLDTLNLKCGTIHEYHAASQELRLRAVSGLPEALIDQLDHISAPSLSDVVLPLLTVSDAETYSLLSVPLVSHGDQIGLLSVYKDDHNPSHSNLNTLLLNIGQQLGVVMDNAILFEEATRRVTLSTDLSRLSLAISAQLDRSAILDLICRESMGVFDVQGAYIWLVKDHDLVGAAAYGPGAARFAGHSLDRRDLTLLPARALAEWRPRYQHRIDESQALPREFLELSGARSAIAVPLIKADVPFGVLLLTHTQDAYAFADWLTEQIGLFGVQMALAIQNAGLFEEVRRRLDQLRLVNEVGRYATAILSPAVLVDGVARQLFGLFGYDILSVVQVEGSRLRVQAVFVRGQPLPADYPMEGTESFMAVAAQSIQQSEPVLKNQACTCCAEVLGLEAPFDCSSLAVPLVITDEVIGALVVERRGHNSVVQDDLDVLEPLVAQLAVSISNARLFEQIRQQALELELRVNERTAEIREQQERTNAILTSVADAVIVFDLNRHVIMTNPVARRLFDQHDLDMDLGRHTERLVERALSRDDEARDLTEIIELGNLALQAKAAHLLQGGEVHGAVVVLRDISRLQELDRMKDTFVSNVSHELRTPLANLKLYLSLLQQGRAERQPAYVEVMSREIERLARLINDLLQISRLQGEQRAERPQVRNRIDFEAMVESVIQQNLVRAENERKELLYECLSSPLPSSYGDPDQLFRALTNVVSNAINYTPEGGRIVVHSWSEFVDQSTQEWVIIEVTDTGIGIPAKDLATIFDRFYRGSNVSPTIPGTGLGLAILKDIVELHQGRIEVESEEGRGSTFRLRLPVLMAQKQELGGGA